MVDVATKGEGGSLVPVDVEGIRDWKEEAFAPNFEHHWLSDVTYMESL
jgi:hypothetical protein